MADAMDGVYADLEKESQKGVVPGDSGRKGGDEAVSGKKDDTERKPATTALTDEQKKAVEQCKKEIGEASSLKELNGISKMLKDGKAFYIKDDGSPEYVSLPDAEIAELEKAVEARREILKTIDNIAESSDEETDKGTDKGEDSAEGVDRRDESEQAGVNDAIVEVIEGKLKDAGIEVIDDEEDVRRVRELSEKKRKSANDTALPEDESSFKGTVVPFTDTANIQKNLDELALKYKKRKRLSFKSIISDLSKALSAEHKGSGSQYVTIETKNGDIVTIRIANHNASTEKMDNAGRDNAISIVISRKQNNGIQGGGKAHITEYFYSDKALRKAGGKAVADIAGSLKQVFYSGEYKDTTGLAEVQEVNDDASSGSIRQLRTKDGDVYGFVHNGKIYIDKSKVTPETLIHEYVHLWAEAVRRIDPKEWGNIVRMMKKCGQIWKETTRNYPELTTDDEIAEEVLATYSGRRGEKQLQEKYKQIEMSDMTDSAKETARGAIESVRKAISKFWDRFRKLFDFSRVSAERVADKALLDLLDSVNPNMLIDRYARPEGVRTDTESAPAESAEERNEEPHTDDAEESSLSGDDIEGQTVTDDAAREKGILDALVTIMKKAGLKVYVNASNGQSVLNRENREGRRVRTLSAKKRRALETASLGNNPRSLTVVSSTHGTKVLNNLDNLADKLKKSKTQPKIFIGELAKALEASSKGSGSQYATFETKNGQIVTIRISNHNASAERMDTAGRSNAISIVISPKQNHGISNNGDAHIIEFYYSPIKLRKATGKPLAEIVGSVKQALYSGEYKDTTGLAEVQEVNEDTVREYGIRFFRNKDGEVYGFVLDGEIYLDPKVANSETAIHEYTHLWADALRKLNPEEWKNIVSLMKGTSLWEEIKKSYPELENDFLGIHFTTADEVADRVLGDLLSGVNPIEAMGDKADTERAEESGKETARENSSVDAEDEGSDRTEASTERTLEIALGLLSRIENSESSDDALLSSIADGDFTGYEALSERIDNESAPAEPDEERKEESQTDDAAREKGILDALVAIMRKAGLKVHVNAGNGQSVLNRENREGRRVRAQVQTLEEKKIVEKARKDGTYMKAPNGEPTNLTERQWVQVRTKAFKKWFGDWEKAARIEKLRHSEPISITGNEIKPDGNFKQYKKNALEYGKSLRGEYTNKDTGEIINIYAQSLKETLRHDGGSIAHIQSIAAIPQIIENGIYIDTLPNENKEKNPKVKEYMYLVCGLKIGGVDYTVKAAIAVDNKGNRYYDHTLTEIKKEKLLDELDRITSPSSQGVVNPKGFTQTEGVPVPSGTLSDIKDIRLLSILQTNSSKVVDENGEPMVVYHQTNSKQYVNRETGEIWDNLNWQERQEWENRDDWDEYWEESDFNTFDNKNYGRRSIEMPAFFFSTKYDEYHEYGERTIPAFLNIKNPIINPTIPNAGVTDTAGEDAMNELMEQGYDGFIRMEDGEVYEINAFSPNQIKSATDNIGKFSTENDDIRFFKTADGEVYGFVLDGEIYLDLKVADSETAIHEYTHLWADALRKLNPEEWKNIVSLMKGTSLWEEIRKSYPELEADFLGIHFTTADEVADRVLGDLLSGVNPVEYMNKETDTERKAGKKEGETDIRNDASAGTEGNGSSRKEGSSERTRDIALDLLSRIDFSESSDDALLSRIVNSDFTGYEALSERIDNESAPAEPDEERKEESQTDEAAREKGILDALVTIMRKAGLKVHVNAGKGQSVLNRENRNGRRVRTQTLTPEEKEIIEKARKDGTYMKAPNGKPTNLTERQWMQVRTKAFKKWFGDWEKAALLQQIRETWDGGKNTWTYRFSPSEKLKKELKEKLGVEASSVAITDSAVRHIRNNHGSNEALRDQKDITPEDILTLEYLINNFDDSVSAENDKAGNQQIKLYKVTNGVVTILTVNRGNGKEFVVTAWEKMSSASMIESLRLNVRNALDVAKVQKDLQKIRETAENSSKFVDENGEPKVFYHNTDAEITIFDSALNGSHTDAGWLGDGFYFYGNEMEGNGYGKNKIAVFLNVRDPYYATSEENERLAELNDRDASIEFREDVESEGYDGVYYNGDLRQEAVVFSPNQIKSATDNIGTFSTENDDIRFFRDKYDEIYGFVLDGEIYLDPKVANSETAIHEYTHLWADALRKLNPEEWKNIVSLMKGTSLWEEIKKSYPELENDDEIADEVLATYSGRRGAERLREERRKIEESDSSESEKSKALRAIDNIRNALNRFWNAVADFLGIHFTTADEVADRVLGDLLSGVNPVEAMGDKADTERAEESGKETARKDSSVDAEDEGSDRTEAASERAGKNGDKAGGKSKVLERMREIASGLLSRIANSDFTGYETLPEDVKDALGKRAKEIVTFLKKKDEQNRKAEEDRHIEGNGTYSNALKRIRSVKDGNDAMLKRVLDGDFSDFPELSESEEVDLFAEASEKVRNLQTDGNVFAKTEDEDREEQHMRRDGQLPAPDRQKKSKVGGTRHDGRCTRAVCFCAYVEKFKTRLLEIPLSDEAYNWLPAKPETARPTDKVFHPATPTPR